MNKIPTDKEYRELLKIAIKKPITRSELKSDKRIFKAFRLGTTIEHSMGWVIENSIPDVFKTGE